MRYNLLMVDYIIHIYMLGQFKLPIWKNICG